MLPIVASTQLKGVAAGEIEAVVVDQLRALLRHPDVIARTYREIQERTAAGPDPETIERLAALRQRRHQIQDSIRAVLSIGNRCGHSLSVFS